MNFLHLKVYRRLILSVLLVVTVFILLGFWGLNSNKNAMKREIEKDVWASSNYYVTQLETDFETLIGLQLNFVNNQDLMELIVARDILTPYQFTEKVKKVSNQLLNIRQLYQLVDSSMIYIPGQNSIISATPPYYAQASDEIWLDHRMVSIFSPGDDNIYLVGSHPVRYSESENQKYMFQTCIKITRQRLETTLLTMQQHENGSVILLDENRQVLAAVGQAGDKLIQDCLGELELQMKSDQYEGSFEFDSDVNQLAVYSISEAHDFGVIYTIPTQSIYEPLNIYTVQIFALALLSIVLLFAYAQFIRKVFLRPMTLILNAFEKTKGLNDRIESHDTDEFQYLYTQYNNMVERMDRLIREVYESKYRLSMAQFQQLQYQIRPHFLYNSIYTIYRMAKYDGNEGIASFVQHLGRYYQYIAKLSNDKILLSEEIGHVIDYLKIQELRFSNKIEINIQDIPEEIEGIYIIPLVLHPLVENIFEHAIKSIEDKAQIDILFSYEESIFTMEVRDNGPGMPETELHALQNILDSEDIPDEMHGLINTNYRLRISFGQNSGVRVANLDGKGFSSKIVIDFSDKSMDVIQDV
jgi:sensor histidine kinase YesM